jgi:gluconate kinase
MGVAMMPVPVVILIIRVARGVVIWMSAFMMVMIMRMKARSGHILPPVTMQASRRCPGKLERIDEHDDQDDEATHGVHSTEMIVSTKGSFIPSTR